MHPVGGDGDYDNDDNKSQPELSRRQRKAPYICIGFEITSATYKRTAAWRLLGGMNECERTTAGQSDSRSITEMSDP